MSWTKKKRKIELSKVTDIIKYTQERKYTRPEIAKLVGVSKITVYNIQREYNLI